MRLRAALCLLAGLLVGCGSSDETPEGELGKVAYAVLIVRTDVGPSANLEFEMGELGAWSESEEEGDRVAQSWEPARSRIVFEAEIQLDPDDAAEAPERGMFLFDLNGVRQRLSAPIELRDPPPPEDEDGEDADGEDGDDDGDDGEDDGDDGEDGEDGDAEGDDEG